MLRKKRAISVFMDNILNLQGIYHNAETKRSKKFEVVKF